MGRKTMNNKQSCVIDAQGMYVTFVLIHMVENEDGQAEEIIQYYALQDGDRLVDTTPPTMRPYAGATGFICPMWDADASAWVEAATEEEIAAWEVEHPAPKKPEPVPTVEELQAKITALTTSNQMLEDCLVEMAGVIYA